MQPRGRSCRVAPATTDAHRSAWRLIGSSRVRPRRRSGNNAPGGNAARTGPGRATYTQCGLHCAALRTMSGGGRCKGAVGDAKGRQAMQRRRAMQRGGRRCTEWRTMHGAVGDVRARAMHGGGGRVGEWCAMLETVYDANKRRTVQRSGGRCIVSVGQYTEMVYDARRAGDAGAAAMHGAAGDARSADDARGAAGNALSRRTMHRGDGPAHRLRGGKCAESRVRRRAGAIDKRANKAHNIANGGRCPRQVANKQGGCAMKQDLKIRSMELFKVPPRWLFLKITTEGG